MLGEKRIIELADAIMGRGEGRLNRCMESDAEILEFGTERLLFTTDEYSAEDMLPDNDPYLLGWNVTAGAVSDILAMGGEPRYVAHALAVDGQWTEKTVQEFYRGTADVLKEVDATFIGGDVGTSPFWRCTVSVIGACGSRTLTRKGAASGDLIYITGKVGLGNLQAALKIYEQKSWLVKKMGPLVGKFPVRSRESSLIGRFATSCLDTSDGVAGGLHTLAQLNDIGFEVEHPPYLKAGKLMAGLLSLPETLLFLGECGEYELLFTIDPLEEEAFLNRAQEEKLNFFKLGVMRDKGKILRESGKIIDLDTCFLRGRDFADVKTYLEQLIAALARSTRSC